MSGKNDQNAKNGADREELAIDVEDLEDLDDIKDPDDPDDAEEALAVPGGAGSAGVVPGGSGRASGGCRSPSSSSSLSGRRH